MEAPRLVFGPVPSRRLGRSLGVNNVYPKTCSYSCVYCQLGRTTMLTIERRPFYRPEEVYAQVEARVRELRLRGERVDYITFVPDGEPTLDANLGWEIALLKRLGIPVAVITNASLLWRGDVRRDLMGADYVSVKVDAVSEGLWRRVNRPHPSLRLDLILEGIRLFSREYGGILVSETMLINGVNYKGELEAIADYLASLERLSKAYIAIPTRPPAEGWVKPASEETVNAAFQVFTEKLGPGRVELLVGFEGTGFTSTGNIEEDLLSITAVHPMRRDAVEDLLKRTGSDWSIVEKLVNEGKLVEVEYRGFKYYMRRFRAKAK